MPKSAGRRKRIRAARTDAAPTALPESAAKQHKGKSGGSSNTNTKINGEAGSKEKELLPIVKKLSSSEATERLWSTSAVSHILSTADSSTRRLLQSNNVVALLIERLADAELQVQAEACGALRNLAIEGGFEVCAEMFNKSVVPALAKHLDPLLGTLVADLDGQKAIDDKERSMRKLLWEWTENLSTLFWCLAETSDKAFKAVAALHSLSNLLYTVLRNAVPLDGSSMSSAKVPVTLALAAAQAVYVLTDSNVPSAPNFPLPRDASRSAAYSNTKSMLLAALQNLANAQAEAEGIERQSMFKVLLIGIFQNLSHQQAYGKQVRSEEDEEFAQLALQMLVSGLDGVDLSSEATAVLEAHRALPKSNAVNSAEAAALSAPKVKLDQYEARWTRLRLTLEILGELVGEMDGVVDAGLLGGEVYEEWHGIENGADEEMDADKAQTVGTSQQQPTAIGQDALTILAKLPHLLLQLARPTTVSFAKQPLFAERGSKSGLISTQPIENAATSETSHVPILSDLASLLHARALECLNNLLITIGRSGAVAQGLAGEAVDDAVDDSMMLLADGEHQELGEAAGDDEEMEDEDPVADDDEEREVSQTASTALNPYASTNLESLQQCWETLFEHLVQFTALLDQRTEGSAGPSFADGKKKGASTAQTSEDALETAIEADLGSVWALARLCVDGLTIGQGETQLLLKMCEEQGPKRLASDTMVRVAGALAVLASRAEVSNQENEVIGRALLSQIALLAQGKLHPDDAELYTQVIDSIIDIYSDETRTYDAIFVNGGYLQALEAIVPAYRKLVKGIDKRKSPDLRAQADGVAINIAEFVKYRRSL